MALILENVTIIIQMNINILYMKWGIFLNIEIFFAFSSKSLKRRKDSSRVIVIFL